MKVYRLFPCLLLSSHLVFAENPSPDPYFAGTLLSIIPTNIAPNAWSVEPYLYITEQTAIYNSHWKPSHHPQFLTLQTLLQLETGITSWLDITLYSSFYYTRSHSLNSYLYGDTQVALGFQILRQQKDTWMPDLRFLLQETFPTGKYDHLNPHKHLADVSGAGAYITWISSVLHKTFSHFTLSLSLDYLIPSRVSVSGYSLYGGPAHTTLRPGDQFIGNLGIEYSLTRRWIVGLDLHYQHQNSSSHPTRSVGTSSLEQFSLAPCIEYNPSPNFGFEAGSWFTVAGRNATAFISTIGTVYWLF